jgi:formylglycine-generating enzyme required for sulfatase activity
MSKTEMAPKKWSSRVRRGGSWTSVPQFAALRYRNVGTACSAGDRLGVRLVEVLDEFDQDTSRNHNAIKAQ